MTARGRGSGRGRGGAGERGAAKKQTTESPTMSSPARGPEIESRAEKKGRLATPYTKNRSGFLSFFSTLAPMRLAKETRTAFFIAVAM